VFLIHIDRRHGDNLYPAGELCQHRARQGGIRCGIRRRSAVYDPYFIQTEFEIIQSQLVLNSVIDKLKLNVAWGKKYLPVNR